MAAETIHFRPGADDRRRLAELHEALARQVEGALVRPLTTSDVIRQALADSHAARCSKTASKKPKNS